MLNRARVVPFSGYLGESSATTWTFVLSPRTWILEDTETRIEQWRSQFQTYINIEEQPTYI